MAFWINIDQRLGWETVWNYNNYDKDWCPTGTLPIPRLYKDAFEKLWFSSKKQPKLNKEMGYTLDGARSNSYTTNILVTPSPPHPPTVANSVNIGVNIRWDPEHFNMTVV